MPQTAGSCFYVYLLTLSRLVNTFCISTILTLEASFTKEHSYRYQRNYVLETLGLAHIICGTMSVTSRVRKGSNLGQTNFERAQLYNRRERVNHPNCFKSTERTYR